MNMTTPAQLAIQRIGNVPQAQYSLTEQLEELHQAAVALGLYDADDFIKRWLPRAG
jgi:hypothetical protein